MLKHIKLVVSTIFGISLSLAVLMLALWAILGTERMTTVLTVIGFLFLVLMSILIGGVYTYLAFRSGAMIGSHIRMNDEQAELSRAKAYAQFRRIKQPDLGYPPLLPGDTLEAEFTYNGFDEVEQ